MKNAYAGLAAAPLLAAALAGAAPTAAQAQGMTDGWAFEVALYGWFPAISGSTSFPTVGASPSIDVSTREVIDSLKMAFMGVVQVRNGPWGVWNDLFYANLGGSKQGTRNISIGGRPLPIGVDVNLGLDAKTWIWTVAGTYAIKSDSEGNTDMMFGIRMLDMTNSLDWSFRGTGPGVLPPRTGNAQVSDALWDGVVGLKGRALLGEDRRWFVPLCRCGHGPVQAHLADQRRCGLPVRLGRPRSFVALPGLQLQERLEVHGPELERAADWRRFQLLSLRHSRSTLHACRPSAFLSEKRHGFKLASFSMAVTHEVVRLAR